MTKNQGASFLFGIGGLVLFIYSLYQLIGVIIIQKRSKKTVGKIINMNTVVPERMKIYNAKFAQIEYIVKEKHYHNEKPIQVGMLAQIGDHIEIKYDKNNPNVVYTKSFAKMLIALLLSVLFIVISIYLTFNLV